MTADYIDAIVACIAIIVMGLHVLRITPTSAATAPERVPERP